MNPTPTKPRRWRPNTVFFLLVGLLFSITALGQPAFLKEGLVAYYPFNGNANDESGNGNNGFSNTALLAKDRFGRGDASYYFNGLNSCIQVGDSFNLRPSTFTVSAWVLGNNYNGFNQIITKNAGVGKTESINLVINNNNGWNLTAQVGSPAAYGTLLRSPSSISESAWHQVVFTFAGAGQAQSIFLDGNLLSKNIASDSVVYDNSPWTIGAQFESQKLSYFFDGNIDDVRIYNRALSDTEVKALYNYESTPPNNSFITNGLVAYYPFNGNANDEAQGAAPGKLLPGASLSNDYLLLKGNSLKIDGINGLNKGVFIEKPIINISDKDYCINIWFNSSSGEKRLQTLFNTTPHAAIGIGFNREGDQKLSLLLGDGDAWKTGFGFSRTVVEIGKWNMATLVKNGDDFKLFLNGTNEANLKLNTTVVNKPVSMWLGSIGPIFPGALYPGEVFAGQLDNVRIYNRALSDAEVKALYNYESTPAIQSPVLSEQPQSQSVTAGNDATFCVTLKDAGTYNYQWQFNEQNIAGATLNCYTVNSVTAAMNGGRYRVIVSNSAGTVISDSATLTVVTPPPPAISSQPIGRTVQEGSNVSFAVVATGQGSLVYQWQLNEQNLPGATSATLNLNGVKQNQSGRYRVLVSSPYGVTISDTVSLIVNANPPPTIVTQPISKTPAEGTQVSLTVTATGLGALTYQWQVNNQNIPGATSSTLVLSAVRPSANGKYRVIVGNPYGTTISTEATVTVVVTDADSDGLSDYEELLFGTNINKADSDGDGLSDFAEVKTHGSNPLTTDTDGDGYSDGIEVARDGNPNNRSVTPTGALAVFPAVDVEFHTLNGVRYQLEVSTDMAVWTAQGGVVVGNGGSQNHLVRASKATQFWRLKVVQ